jgi:hypothetical protein
MNLANRNKNNTSNLSQSKNQGSNPKVTDSSMLNFEDGAASDMSKVIECCFIFSEHVIRMESL